MAPKKKVAAKASKRTVIHVTYRDSDGQWHIAGEAGRSLQHFDRKSDGIAAAKERAKAAPLGQVVIHGKDGKIEREYTYGADPRRTKG
jgi:hypothetical protein